VLLPLLFPVVLQANRTASSGLLRSRTISSGFCHCLFPMSLTFLETLKVGICPGQTRVPDKRKISGIQRAGVVTKKTAQPASPFPPHQYTSDPAQPGAPRSADKNASSWPGYCKPHR